MDQADSEAEIEIVIPPVADETDQIDHGLVTLTEAICQSTGAESAYGLGGQFGYGEDFENEVFMMHRFCWCDREDCRWCSDEACGCLHPEPKYYFDGKEVTPSECDRHNREIVGELPHNVAKHGTPEYEAARDAFYVRIAERDRRLKTIHQARTHTCEPRGMMADRTEGESWQPNQSAPNFWHKKSGLKVWWYKWIGRDMEVVGADGVDLAAVFAECIASLPPAKSEVNS